MKMSYKYGHCETSTIRISIATLELVMYLSVFTLWTASLSLQIQINGWTSQRSVNQSNPQSIQLLRWGYSFQTNVLLQRYLGKGNNRCRPFFNLQLLWMYIPTFTFTLPNLSQFKLKFQVEYGLKLEFQVHCKKWHFETSRYIYVQGPGQIGL